MALVGTLSTMPLPDLLQWLGSGGKTGKLRVERNKIGKWILFRDGSIVASWSNEPRELLGQFLVSRGKINEQTLREALAVKENSEQQLGEILVSMGVIDHEELTRSLTAKAEETIFSLFDWEQAVFRFMDEEIDEATIAFPIDLRVEDVLLRGMQRLDESRRIRTVFNDPGIVLRQTGRTPSEQIRKNRMARTIYDAINGERTVAEILLHAHASEFLVTKFLFELYRNGFAEVAATREVAGPSPAPAPLPEISVPSPPEPVPSAPSPTSHSALAVEPAVAEVDTIIFEELEEETAPAEVPAAAATAAPVAEPSVEVSLDSDLEVAGNLMSRGEFDAALEILNVTYKAHPGDETLGRLLAEAEACFLEKAYRHYVPPAKIPALLRPPEDLAQEQISPQEYFLLSRIDGVWDVKSIIQVSPIREVDVVRTLKRMREKGFIELRDPG